METEFIAGLVTIGFFLGFVFERLSWRKPVKTAKRPITRN